MGTTADKLQAVLNSKNAIRDKFNLPADMPFSQYAENIKGATDFFKCAEVGPAESGDTEDGGDTGGSDSGSTFKIKISGATFDASVNGEYSYFSDSVKSWVNVWRTTDERAQIHTFENDSYWYLAVDDGDGGYTPRYIGTVNSIGQQPWEVASWQTISGSIESGLTVEKVGGSSGNETPEMPEPVFAEKFNGTLTNNFTQLASAPEYSTIDGRQGLKCDYDHRLLAPCDGFPSGNAPRTMSAWIYCNSGSLSGTWNMFCIYGSDDGFGMRAYSGELYADGTAWQPYETIGDLSENAWQHIVLVGEGDKTVGYINGVKSGEVTYELSTVLTGGLQIGYLYGRDAAYVTDAYISDLQIYDVALSAEQVEELYKKSQDTFSNGASVNSTDIVVSGISDAKYEQANGEYYVYSGEGAGRIWISKHTFSHSGQQCYGKIYQYNQNGTWRLVIVNNPDADSYYGKIAQLNGSTHPDPIGTWDFWDYSGTPVVTAWKTAEEPEAPLAPNTWNGYKAVLVTDTDGKKYYEFEETLTEGLTFGNGFTPVVDKVYDSEAMIMATLSEKNKYPEIASPMDMTGYTKDDWVVSESDYRFDSTRGYSAFYPNGIWAGYSWLQWQNTAQQVLVRQITFGYGGNSNWIYSCRLDGSDDGNTWTEIGTRDCEYEGEDNETILTYPENETAYYYHRLVVLSSNGCAVVWNLLAKRDIDGRNTP